MRMQGIARIALYVTLRLSALLGLQSPALAASSGLQAAAAWRGEYYAGVDLVGAPVLVRSDAAIDFDWGTGTPAPGDRRDRIGRAFSLHRAAIESAPTGAGAQRLSQAKG